MNDHSELKAAAEACKDLLPLRYMHSPGGSLSIRNDHGIVFGVHQNRSFPSMLEANKAHADLVLAASPAAVLALIAENEALRKGRTDWQAECLKRGFEYVRESDDHYVLADLPEMADLLGMLLGVEVRTKDNEAYEEANSRLNEQVEGLINIIHAQKLTTVHFVCDRLPDQDGCRFIELENPQGESLGDESGKWEIRPDGLAQLVVEIAPKPGFSDAFYQVAERLGVTGSRPCSPMEVFRCEILPELDKALKNADRYRWLRDKAQPADWEFIGHQDPDAVDKEIDAAMAKEVSP